MKRIFSKQDFKYYTMLKQVLCDLELANKDYWWLISDFEAYPNKEAYQQLLRSNCLLMSTCELMDMLEEDDFQWVWAVFSAIPADYRSEDILKFDLPHVQDIGDGKYNPCMDTPKLQHPFSEFELYAVDSTCVFLIAEDADLVCRFRESYPLYVEQ